MFTLRLPIGRGLGRGGDVKLGGFSVASGPLVVQHHIWTAQCTLLLVTVLMHRALNALDKLYCSIASNIKYSCLNHCAGVTLKLLAEIK